MAVSGSTARAERAWWRSSTEWRSALFGFYLGVFKPENWGFGCPFQVNLDQVLHMHWGGRFGTEAIWNRGIWVILDLWKHIRCSRSGLRKLDIHPWKQNMVSDTQRFEEVKWTTLRGDFSLPCLFPEGITSGVEKQLKKLCHPSNCSRGFIHLFGAQNEK